MMEWKMRDITREKKYERKKTIRKGWKDWKETDLSFQMVIIPLTNNFVFYDTSPRYTLLR
jgi:hypothetical protein